MVEILRKDVELESNAPITDIGLHHNPHRGNIGLRNDFASPGV